MQLPNVNTPNDLQTTHTETVKGFIAQAQAKTTKASAHIVEAQRLMAALQHMNTIQQVTTIPDIQDSLTAASGISDKARKHLTAADIQSSLTQIIGSIATQNPLTWKEELVYRFLLTRGDTLGGSMRNYIGALGGSQLSASIVASLIKQGINYRVDYSTKNPTKIIALEWTDRLLVFDKKPKFIDKNIDVILLDTTKIIPQGVITLEQSAAYVACGELKGGVDPGGADEHWKTAGSAFQRIRDVFGSHIPHLFFVAAAIEASMAREIFAQVQGGQLEYAANLTVSQQLTDLTDWLTNL